MTAEPAAPPDRRARLSRARVLDAAIDLADREGIDAVSMRRLGQALGVEAMSLYTHVRNKDDLLDGMADALVGRIPVGRLGQGWQGTLRDTILGARAVMLRHAWAARVVETRPQPGPATIRYLDAVTATLLEGGFPVDLAHRGMHVLGGRVLGFGHDLFVEGPDDDVEFAFGLDLILDGLERERARRAPRPAAGRQAQADWRQW